MTPKHIKPSLSPKCRESFAKEKTRNSVHKNRGAADKEWGQKTVDGLINKFKNKTILFKQLLEFFRVSKSFSWRSLASGGAMAIKRRFHFKAHVLYTVNQWLIENPPQQTTANELPKGTRMVTQDKIKIDDD